MANKKKVYGLEIDTNAPQTLEGLNKQLAELKEKISTVQIGTEEFTHLSKQISATDANIKNLNKGLEGLDTEKKVAALGDIAGGITGAFSLATQSISLFSSEAGQGFNEASQKALGYIQAITSIQAVAKGFSGDAGKMFSTLKGGFTSALESAKGFSKGAKIALAGIGIGLIIAAVGLLIENWDKLMEVVGLSSSEHEKFAKQAKADIEALNAVQQRLTKEYDTQVRLLQLAGAEENKIFNKRKEQAAINAALANNALKKAEELYQQELDHQVEVAETDKWYKFWGDSIDEAREKTKEAGEALDKAKENAQAAADAVAIVNAETAAWNENAKDQERENALNREISVLQAMGDKEREIYTKKKQFVTEEIASLNQRISKGETLNFLERERLKDLKAQSQVLDIQESQRLKEVDVANKLKLLNAEISKISKEGKEQENELITKVNTILKERQALLLNENNTVQVLLTSYEGLQGLFRDQNKLKELEAELDKTLFEIKEKNLESEIALLTRKQKAEKEGSEEYVKLQNEILKNETELLNLRINRSVEQNTQKQTDAFRNLSLAIKDMGADSEDYFGKVFTEIDELIVNSDGSFERLSFNVKEAFQNLGDEGLQNFKKELNEINKQFLELGKPIKIDFDMDTGELSVVGREIKNWRESFQDARKEFLKFKEDARVNGEAFEVLQQDVSDYLGAAMQGIGQLMSTMMDGMQQRISEMTTQLSEITEEMDSTTERRKELEELLGEAAGDRREALISELNAIKKKESELAKQRTQAEKQIAAEKNKAAKTQRQLDIANAASQTALAVIQALPNLVLASIVGALGLANIALISSQPLPQFAKGGFIGEGITPAIGGRDSTGEKTSHIVQLHSDEYVVPRRVVQSEQGSKLVGALETMRTKRMAEGGIVSKVPNIQSQDTALLQAIRDQVNVVSVVDFETVKDRLVQAQDAASI